MKSYGLQACGGTSAKGAVDDPDVQLLNPLLDA
jgi:hypothetical protein